MKKIINIKRSLIIILVITIVFLGIGFIVLSIELKNEKNEINNFDVSFTGIKKISSVKGGKISPKGETKVINHGKEIKMNFNLNSVHDELSYIATIKNNGTLPAEIIGIMESPDYSTNEFKSIIKPVTITLSDVEGKIIPAGEEIELKVVVYYNPTQDIVVNKKLNYKIGLITKSR